MISQTQIDTVRIVSWLGRSISTQKWVIPDFAGVDLRHEPLVPNAAQTTKGLILIVDEHDMPYCVITPWGVKYILGTYANSPKLMTAIRNTIHQFALSPIFVPTMQLGTRTVSGKAYAVGGRGEIALPSPSLKPHSQYMSSTTAHDQWRAIARIIGG